MRWPWNRPKTVPGRNAARLDAVERTLAELVKRVDVVAERTPDARPLRQEFEELQDKVYRWMQRTRVRERREDAAAAAEGNGAEGDALQPEAASGSVIPREVWLRRGGH